MQPHRCHQFSVDSSVMRILKLATSTRGYERISNTQSPRSFIPQAFRTVCIAVLLVVSVQGCALGDEQRREKTAVKEAGSDIVSANGKALYLEHCAGCHKGDGSGYVTVIPPLVNSDYIATDVNRLVSVAVDGLSGPITVNGLRYEGVMPAMSHLSDVELAAILNYVLRQWGNQAYEFSGQEIGDYRRAASREKNRPVRK